MDRQKLYGPYNKYGVAPKDKRTYNGVVYDSKAEMVYAVGLDMQLRAALITGWICQVTIPLGPDFKTRIDFLVFLTGLTTYKYTDAVTMDTVDYRVTEVEFVEIKGHETPKFKDVRRLWKKHGPGPLFIKTRKGSGWTTEVLPGKPKP